MKKIKHNLAILSILFFIFSCGEPNDDIHNSNELEEHKEIQMPEIKKAIAIMTPTEGNETNGIVSFSKMPGNKVKVSVEIYNLSPGKHGFHIHEFGDCSANDGTSAGGHYHLEHDHHGSLEESETHIGDLGNLEANQDGIAKTTFITDKLSLNGVANIIGRGIIIHQDEDDLKTQPTGGAGARVACGVIGISK